MTTSRKQSTRLSLSLLPSPRHSTGAPPPTARHITQNLVQSSSPDSERSAKTSGGRPPQPGSRPGLCDNSVRGRPRAEERLPGPTLRLRSAVRRQGLGTRRRRANVRRALADDAHACHMWGDWLLRCTHWLELWLPQALVRAIDRLK